MVDALFVALCVLIANHFGGATPYGHEEKGVVCMGIRVYGMWSRYDVGARAHLMAVNMALNRHSSYLY